MSAVQRLRRLAGMTRKLRIQRCLGRAVFCRQRAVSQCLARREVQFHLAQHMGAMTISHDYFNLQVATEVCRRRALQRARDDVVVQPGGHG